MKTHQTIKIFLLILVITLSSGHRLLSYSPTHKPPCFTDPDRAAKVMDTKEAVNEIFQSYAIDHHMPGFSYGVVLDGVLLYSNSYGYSNLERKIEVDTKTLFRIASMSKSVTALAVLQLRDAGKLSLDDPMSKYLPEADGLTYLTTDAPEITIRHLLTHGAGFPEDNPWGDRQLADTDQELMQIIEDGVSFSNVPGIAYEYSNLGFALLGQIVSRVSGMDFQEYTQKYIFTPLGMNTTVWEYENAPEEQLALGYAWIDGEYVHVSHEHHGAYGAMGGLITSIEDFANYVALHLTAWPPRSDADPGPLKRSSLREMHHPWRFNGLEVNYRNGDGRECCPTVSAYAYGLRWAQDCDEKINISHSGGLPGFGSNWVFLPDYGLAVMSFDNRTYGTTYQINMNVLDTIITLAKLAPRTLPVSDILEKRQQDLVSFLPHWTGAAESDIFADNFFMDNQVADLVRQTVGLYREVGAIRHIGPVKPSNQLRGTFIIEGERNNIEIFFTLNPEKQARIQEVRMRIVEKSK